MRTTTAPAAPPAVRGAVLITIDTLRADRLGAYGTNVRARLFSMGSQAAEARFDRAYAPAPITLTSTARF